MNNITDSVITVIEHAAYTVRLEEIRASRRAGEYVSYRQNRGNAFPFLVDAGRNYNDVRRTLGVYLTDSEVEFEACARGAARAERLMGEKVTNTVP